MTSLDPIAAVMASPPTEALAPKARAEQLTESAGAEFSASLDRLGIVRHEARKASPAEKFESFVLRNFVESMLPSAEDGYFGTGTAGNIWRSMMAEQIGDALAEDGGVGIAALLRERDPALSDPALDERAGGLGMAVLSSGVEFAPGGEPGDL